MKRRIDISLKSLGSEYETDPDPKELVKWISSQEKVRCDLISYKLESSLLSQKKVDMPCTGGNFYSERIIDSIGGLKSKVLCAEPYPISDDMSSDAERVRRIRKGCKIALPPPSALGLSDYLFNDYQDFIPALCEVYKKLMREQRDKGVSGHIIVADRFSSIELEELSGLKTEFFTPEGGSNVLSSILEYQDKIAIYPKKLNAIFDIISEYDIRSITILDPEAEDTERLLSEFDPADITLGGYCRGCDSDYWNNLKERSYVMV